MKLRVTIRRGQQIPPANLQITVDGTATVGDIARALGTCQESGIVWDESTRFTLRCFDQVTPRGRVLEPQQNILHAGVQSGAHIELAQPEGVTSGGASAVLRVLGGPDAGTEVMLQAGKTLVGRSPQCEVRLTDPRVSKVHAQVDITDRIEITDLNSANGVLVGGDSVSKTVLAEGDQVVLGDTRLQILQLKAQTHGPATADVEFIRSPRVIARPVARELDPPKVPQEPQTAIFPILMLFAPLIMGTILFMFTRSFMSIIFISLSPLMMIGSWGTSKMQAKKQRRIEEKNFREQLVVLDETLTEAANLQREQLKGMYPSLTEYVAAAAQRQDALWSRRPEHPEFLTARLGIGDVAPAVSIGGEGQRSGRPELLRELDELRAKHRWVRQAPVSMSLAESGNLGVCGDMAMAAQVIRGFALQLAISHSPAELTIGCLTSPAGKERWRWLEWLPHVVSPYSPIGDRCVASDPANSRRIIDSVEELVEARFGKPVTRGPKSESEGDERKQVPAVVLFVDDASIDYSRLNRIAETGPDASVHLVWLAPERTQLPAACRTYVEVGQSFSEVGMVREEIRLNPFEAEGADVDTAAYVARLLAPVVDSGAALQDESDLPAFISMGSLVGRDLLDDPDLVLTRWRENQTLIDHHGPAVPRTSKLALRAPVGHTGLEPFTLDLRAQGPHALVGGTTGAGKSEFLQAWVLGMAQAISPDRLTFLFVDYKGGAAFAHCLNLPHCVGLVTDLSPYLVRRALISLRAEIHRREKLLNAKSAKDMLELEMRGDPECPPSLIIIIDEFAALKMEVPEFVDGVIDIAQRGRSLGLHLVMATQRPAGVIGDNIRANTNLRIALRMNDVHDSKDVLGDPMSASFDPSLPGRGAARVGPGRILRFQGAYPGARTTTSPAAAPVDVVQFDFGNQQAWRVPTVATDEEDVDEDIVRLVRTLRHAAGKARIPAPHRPWVDGLATAYDLMKLRQRRDDELVLGVIDDPQNQRHYTEYFQPDAGNLLIVGGGGSGKTTALRSLAIAAGITPRTGPAHVFGFDFAGRGLASLEMLPHVGSIISGDDDERVARFIRRLGDLMDERAARYGDVNAASLGEYRDLSGNKDEPRYLILFDGFGGFQKTYGEGSADLYALHSALARVMAEGRAVGIHFAVTIGRANAMPNAVASAFPRRLVLRQPNEDAYLDLGVPRDILDPSSPPGRCLQVGKPQELQLATLGGKASIADQITEMKQLARALERHHTRRPEPVLSLPTLLPRAELPRSAPGRPIIGLSDYDLGPLVAPTQTTVLVAGPAGCGKSNTLAVYAAAMRDAFDRIELIHLAPGRTSLTSLPLWDRSASSASEVTELAEELIASAGEKTSTPRRAIFAESVPALNPGTGDALPRLVRACLNSGDLFVAEGISDQWSKLYELKEVFKSGGALLLEPGADDGYNLMATKLPRFSRASMSPGRGFWVSRGEATKVQVALRDG